MWSGFCHCHVGKKVQARTAVTEVCSYAVVITCHLYFLLLAVFMSFFMTKSWGYRMTGRENIGIETDRKHQTLIKVGRSRVTVLTFFTLNSSPFSKSTNAEWPERKLLNAVLRLQVSLCSLARTVHTNRLERFWVWMSTCHIYDDMRSVLLSCHYGLMY